LGEPLRGASPHSRRAIRYITFAAFGGYGGSATIPLAARLRLRRIREQNATHKQLIMSYLCVFGGGDFCSFYTLSNPPLLFLSIIVVFIDSLCKIKALF
jgi:hypothetical protein